MSGSTGPGGAAAPLAPLLAKALASSGLLANFNGRVTLSPGSTLPGLMTRSYFVIRDILCNVQDLK